MGFIFCWFLDILRFPRRLLLLVVVLVPPSFRVILLRMFAILEEVADCSGFQ